MSEIRGGEVTLGLYYYDARWYDPALGRFIQADTIVPDAGDVLAFDRYAYVKNNPLRYVDPTGHVAEYEDTAAQSYVDYLYNIYGVTIVKDWGLQLIGGVETWVNGDWTLDELDTVYQAVGDLAAAMGGADEFKGFLGGVTIEQRKQDALGYGRAHHISLHNTAAFDEWTVVHELAHAWDGANGWALSYALEDYTGGVTNWLSGFILQNTGGCADFSERGCNRAGYYYGQIPPAGSDRNFNRKEDFAESVTAYVYPLIAQSRASAFSRGLSYSDFTMTIRWEYIDRLVNGTIRVVK